TILRTCIGVTFPCVGIAVESVTGTRVTIRGEGVLLGDPRIFPIVEIAFRLHERTRVCRYCSAKFRMLLYDRLQCRVALHELPVVEQRWILTNLLGDFGMAVHEVVKHNQVTVVNAVLFAVDTGASPLTKITVPIPIEICGLSAVKVAIPVNSSP